MSIINLILDAQTEYYNKFKRPVSMLVLNQSNYQTLLKELEQKELFNLHGMMIVVNTKVDFQLI